MDKIKIENHSITLSNIETNNINKFLLEQGIDENFFRGKVDFKSINFKNCKIKSFETYNKFNFFVALYATSNISLVFEDCDIHLNTSLPKLFTEVVFRETKGIIDVDNIVKHTMNIFIQEYKNISTDELIFNTWNDSISSIYFEHCNNVKINSKGFNAIFKKLSPVFGYFLIHINSCENVEITDFSMVEKDADISLICKNIKNLDIDVKKPYNLKQLILNKIDNLNFEMPTSTINAPLTYFGDVIPDYLSISDNNYILHIKKLKNFIVKYISNFYIGYGEFPTVKGGKIDIKEIGEAIGVDLLAQHITDEPIKITKEFSNNVLHKANKVNLINGNYEIPISLFRTLYKTDDALIRISKYWKFVDDSDNEVDTLENFPKAKEIDIDSLQPSIKKVIIDSPNCQYGFNLMKDVVIDELEIKVFPKETLSFYPDTKHIKTIKAHKGSIKSLVFHSNVKNFKMAKLETPHFLENLETIRFEKVSPSLMENILDYLPTNKKSLEMIIFTYSYDEQFFKIAVKNEKYCENLYNYFKDTEKLQVVARYPVDFHPLNLLHKLSKCKKVNLSNQGKVILKLLMLKMKVV